MANIDPDSSPASEEAVMEAKEKQLNITHLTKSLRTF
jgi:hypothetical protein